MKPKVFCPVCRVSFIPAEPIGKGLVITCRVCGAKVEIISVDPQVKSRKASQEPLVEITERVDAFATPKGYVFNENRDLVIEGLLEKKRLYGDFFCPCRFENVPENICPCLDTRQNRVGKDGQCRCGLFVLPGF